MKHYLKQLKGLPKSVFIDFETRSVVDLKKSGAYVYVECPDTEILCMAYAFPGKKPKLWKPGNPFPKELITWVVNGGLLAAWNSNFDRLVWNYILRRLSKRHGWNIPYTSTSKWICAAVTAAQAGYSFKLENACDEFGLLDNERKSKEGTRVMRMLSKPDPKSGDFINDPKLFGILYNYCLQDVTASLAIADQLPFITPSEQILFSVDQRINDRGMRLDMKFVIAAIRMIIAERRKLVGRFNEITGINPTQREKYIHWINENTNFTIADTQEKTMDALYEKVKGGLFEEGNKEFLETLEIFKEIVKSSVAKYFSMLETVNKDGRFRGGYQFYGAQKTGRWAGRGIQPQNFTSRNIISDEEEYREIREKIINKEKIDNLLPTLSRMLKGCWIPDDGNSLFVADYKQIECRVEMVLADCLEGIDYFKSGKDLYLSVASSIYGREITEKDKHERFVGKSATLGLGYAMGAKGLKAHMKKYDLELSGEDIQIIRDNCDCGCFDIENTPELGALKHIVTMYRGRFNEICQFWYMLSNSAVSAMKYPRKRINNFRFTDEDNMLRYRLISDREIVWSNAAINDVDEIHYDHTIGKKKVRKKLWYGLITENVCQATARDVMAGAMVSLEMSKDYKPIGTIHDEVIAEGSKNLTKEGFDDIVMNAVPAYMQNLIEIDSFKFNERYMKE